MGRSRPGVGQEYLGRGTAPAQQYRGQLEIVRVAVGLARARVARPGRASARVMRSRPSQVLLTCSRQESKRLSALAVVTALGQREGMGGPKLEELSRSECLYLLASVSVGRVGLSSRALPAVLPVNFALLDGEVVFRTVEGTKFHAAAAGRVLAFEADGYETDGLSGWSVLVVGVSRVVTEPIELHRAQQLTVEPWGVGGAADRIVRITSTLVSGRRFQRTP